MDREAESLFHEIADLAPADREALYRERNIPQELRGDVERLLAFDRDEDHLLTGSVAASAQSVLDAGTHAEGQRCGPYRLMRLIGSGGMGSVYLAERTDGEIQQRVAIKLLCRARQQAGFVERFLRERQILATLNHPGIARLLDAGHIGDGQPYLAMEFVDGAPIDIHAEKRDLRARLLLFARVCEAVSYAHRNLVVHRDLKPSNILVDGSGQPKLLDFGIAKMLDAAADRTATRDQLLTPEYASPEQIRGAAQTVTSDIYSLGAVLYKLLTGRSPHAAACERRTGIEFAICFTEPDPPSAIQRAIPRDLDYIAAKALRKEPGERYGSADALADDIRAFLESRPVRARSGNAWYRGRKFLRRYWVPVTAAALVVLSLSAGLYVANRERLLAQQRFQKVRQLAHTFVFDLHDEVAKLPGSTKVREMMVRTGLQYLDYLAPSAAGDLDLQKEIAAGYMRIGDAQGYPTKPNLGRLNDALASYRKAGGIYRRIAARDSAYLPDLADYDLRYAGLVRFTHDLRQAKQFAQLSIETFDRARARNPLGVQWEERYLGAWCTVGDLDEDQGSYRQAWAEFSRCLDLAQAQLGQARARRAVANLSQVEERIGTAAQELGMLPRALEAFDREEELLQELMASEPHNPALLRWQMLLEQFRSRVYDDENYPSLEDAPRALESAKRYREVADEMVRQDPNDTAARVSQANAASRVSYALCEVHAPDAVATAERAVRMFDDAIAAGRADHLTVSSRAEALRRLARAQLQAGRHAEALRTAESALAARRKIAAGSAPGSNDRVELVQTLIVAGQAGAAAGDAARGEALLADAVREAEGIAKRAELTNLLPLAKAETALGTYYLQHGRTADARASYERVARLWTGRSNAYVNRQWAKAQERIAATR